MKIDFNINNYVEFTLTECGAKIWNLSNYDYIEKYQTRGWFTEPEMKVEGQLVRVQMWKMLQVFGEHTSLGLETFCKDATIVLEVKE